MHDLIACQISVYIPAIDFCPLQRVLWMGKKIIQGPYGVAEFYKWSLGLYHASSATVSLFTKFEIPDPKTKGFKKGQQATRHFLGAILLIIALSICVPNFKCLIFTQSRQRKGYIILCKTITMSQLRRSKMVPSRMAGFVSY